jgi:hypothetical protein
MSLPARRPHQLPPPPPPPPPPDEPPLKPLPPEPPGVEASVLDIELAKLLRLASKAAMSKPRDPL